jgi:TPP-dependent indolepyruvate ferredoxin oxidoreductase alpha subunit
MNCEDAIVGALRAYADCWYTVPGYPLTRMAEKLGAETVINEKVSLEFAIGDSLSGRRAAVLIKNVGLNACADPLVQATTQGLRAGVVIIAGDDPAATGSQNSQDSRYYGELAMAPVLEPDPEHCIASIESAFEASEQFSRIAIVRVTPALLDAVSGHAMPERRESCGKLADRALTMRGRSERAEQLFAGMFDWSDRSRLNTLRGGTVGTGACACDSHVVTVYPPPARRADLSVTCEEGRPFLSGHRCCDPPKGTAIPETMEKRGYYRTFCRDCPFLPLFWMMKDLSMEVIADAGCSLLTLNPPFQTGIASYGLGSAIGVAARSTGIAITGDYALLHSALPALIEVYHKKIPLLCIVLKNECMGMTGGQATCDIMPYLSFASPVVCRFDETERIRGLLSPKKTPFTLVISGHCPEERCHEIVEY